MFIDVANIELRAGKGGDGAVAWRREKYVASGGPDGGDGGRGGDVVFVVDDNLSTLADFRYKRKYAAPDGNNGFGSKCSGKSGKPLVITVPRGTLIYNNDDGRLLFDLSGNDKVVICTGGRGGWGNQHFATPTRQTPRFAKAGHQGEALNARLELKLLADVGLIGFPNVGKSTLISVVSEAKPKIANYHFTTLTPVLGTVYMGEGSSFVVADIPGIIEGAAEGLGLGHQFLRHVERCRLLIHVLDVSGSEGRDPIEDFNTINAELERFSSELSGVTQIVAANKCDMSSIEEIALVREYIEEKGITFFEVIAPIAQGTKELINHTAAKLATLPPIKRYKTEIISAEDKLNARNKKPEYTINIENDVYMVVGDFLDPVMNSIDPEDYESLQYFQRVLERTGVFDTLRKRGVNDGDTVNVNGLEFEWVN